MFSNPRYITRGVQIEIPPELQIFMLALIDNMTTLQKDYLQVFTLERIEMGGSILQKIIHSQQVPPYTATYCVGTEKPLNQKVYVIDDEDHTTMLLANEY
jgi:Staphylococcal protein of unknown function (DUF960).